MEIRENYLDKEINVMNNSIAKSEKFFILRNLSGAIYQKRIWYASIFKGLLKLSMRLKCVS